VPPRQTAREKFVEGLGKTWGARLAQPPEGPEPREVISTGSLTLDYMLREGGWRRGRIHELLGPPDSAKTTIIISSMREAQLAFPDLAVGYVDMEGTFDDDWARVNGLDLSPGRWDHLYADDSEDASDQARQLCGSGLHSLVAVDSIGGMESRKALEKDAADTLPGRNAQVITRMCKHLAVRARQLGTTVILVNQPRAVIGTMSFADVSAGPKAMQHATTTKVQMSRGPEEPAQLRFEEGMDAETVAVQFKARLVRSKVVPVGRTAEFWVNNRATPEYGPAGLNRAHECITIGCRLGMIKQDGAWYTIPGLPKPFQGRSAAARALYDHPETYALIRDGILAVQGGGTAHGT
jgi:recombination protein RecA